MAELSNDPEYYAPYFDKRGLKLPARIISLIFHPVFVTFGTAFIVYWLQKAEYVVIRNKYPLWLGYLFINLVMFPILAAVLAKALGFISTLTMKEPRDRIIPLIATMIFYFWAYNVAKNVEPSVPLFLRVYLLGCFWGIIMIFLVNIFFKVSMHTTAIGGSIAIFLLMLIFLKINILFILIVALLLGGIIGTSRLILKAHWPFELALGYILGILVQIGAYFFLA